MSKKGSPNQAMKTTTEGSHAIRRPLSSNRSKSNSPAPASPNVKSPSEMTQKRSSRIEGLEAQISTMEKDLKKAKEALVLFESRMAEASEEAREATEELAKARSELEQANRKLRDLSKCEDERILELRKIGHERDKAWQAELEAVRKQQEVESSALLSAIGEIKRLRMHCDVLAESEAEQSKAAEKTQSELRDLNLKLMGKESEVEMLRKQVTELNRSEAEYQEQINVVHLQLEMSKNTATSVRADGLRIEESRDDLAAQLEETRAKLIDLEEALGRLDGGDGMSAIGSQGPEVVSKLGRIVEAAQARNLELEGELKRVRVQAQQWRKAAEVAAAIIAGGGGNEAAAEEKTRSFRLGDEEKNINMLKKIGVLLKKGQQK